MRIKWTQTVVLSGVTHEAGSVADLEDGKAQRYIETGLAVPVAAKKKRTATRKPAETREVKADAVDAENEAGQ